LDLAWAGVPVLTALGGSMGSRFGTTAAQGMGLDQHGEYGGTTAGTLKGYEDALASLAGARI